MEANFKAIIEKFDDSKLYMLHVKVPNHIYLDFKTQGIKRIVVTFNGSTLTHNAFLSDKEYGIYIKLSKDVMKKGNLVLGQEVQVHIMKDTSKYGMPISPEMEELLLQDTEGEAYFHKLTPGKIRSLLFKVNGYKSSDKRIEKSVIILEHLKANNGGLDWKMLNEAFKTGLGDIM